MKFNLKHLSKYNLDNAKPEFEGKSKMFFKLEEDVYFMVFKPHLRSITYNRESNIVGTDIERLKCTLLLMRLNNLEFKTHLLHDEIVKIGKYYGLLVEKVKPIPLEFICRYYAAGSVVKLYPSLVKEGQKFKTPLYKFDVKQDVSVNGVDDPTINENYIVGLEILTEKQFSRAKEILKLFGERMNTILNSCDMKLIDMKMELGFNKKGEIILIDEISQDCIRANDIKTDLPLTKDLYRKMKSDEEVLNAYKEFFNRIEHIMKAFKGRDFKEIHL